MNTEHTICLAGAAPDTGNHGVSALGLSTLAALLERGNTHLTVLDHGVGLRTDASLLPGHPVHRLGCRPGRNFLNKDTQMNARLRQVLGLGSTTTRTLKQARAVLDVSGGDSFSDIYGQARFDQIVRTKKLALHAKCPLVLLPQTFGPFRSRQNRRVARDIIARAKLVFARDARSWEQLKKLLGSDFNPQQHQLGVDLAFGLPQRRPRYSIGDYTIGLNISGLLWHRPDDAAQQFGLACSYRDVMIQLAQHFMDAGYRLLLVPHVIAPHSTECDALACAEFMDHVHGYHGQIQRYKGPYGPSELKGIIAQLHWFTGSRMHATIAALSSGTPVVNMAYSDKAQGVFDTAGLSAGVVDLRRHSTDQIVAKTLAAFADSRRHAIKLDHMLPTVQAIWHRQMDLISSVCTPAGQSERRVPRMAVAS